MLWEIERSEEPGPLILGECFNWSDGHTFPVTPVIVKVKTSFLCGPSSAGVTDRSASTGTCELQRHHRANRSNGNQAYLSFCSKPCSLSQRTIHRKQCHWFADVIVIRSSDLRRGRGGFAFLEKQNGTHGGVVHKSWLMRWQQCFGGHNRTSCWKPSQCLQPLCLIVTRSRASVLIGTTNKGESSYFYDLAYYSSIYNEMCF